MRKGPKDRMIGSNWYDVTKETLVACRLTYPCGTFQIPKVCKRVANLIRF